MDHSITLVTPEMHFDRGFDAYGRGEPIDGHHMNANTSAAAIGNWKAGWLAAKQVDYARSVVKFASGVGTPP